MPVIQIKSLALDSDTAVSDMMQRVTSAFASDVAIAEEHISMTWEILPEQHYSLAGSVATPATEQNFPLLVQLLIPDFHVQTGIETMLTSLAKHLSDACRIDSRRIFIHASLAASGQVYDAGEIMHW